MYVIRKVFLFLSPVLFINVCYSQNNDSDNPLVYYNLKDTINSYDRGTMTVQLYDIVDEGISDSLNQYIKEMKEYGECDDDGVFIYFDIGYTEDSNNIWGVFVTIVNFDMYYTLGGDLFKKINWCSPDYYKVYLYGCCIYENYLVAISTNRYVSEIELSSIFHKREEKITLRMFENNRPLNKYTKYYRMMKPIKKELVDKRNYVSPAIPR